MLPLFLLLHLTSVFSIEFRLSQVCELLAGQISPLGTLQAN